MGRAEGTGQQKVQFELEAEPTTVLYMPAAQRAHRLELFAPMALLYDPAAHACDAETSRCRQVTRATRAGGAVEYRASRRRAGSQSAAVCPCTPQLGHSTTAGEPMGGLMENRSCSS